MWYVNDKIMSILDKLNEGEAHFPCECPVCSSHSGHIYIHRHDDKHCGIWTWCSNCGSYSHMSGTTPTWWKNANFIDEDKLCSDPEYLDEMAAKIDTWANSIAPTEKIVSDNPFVAEDRFKVKLTEELQGIPAGTIGTLVIKDDFKTMSIGFVDSSGKAFNLNITPEQAANIFEVVNN